MRNFFTLLVPLLIIMDPLGNLAFFLLFTRNNTVAEQRRLAFVATVVAAAILIFFLLTGDAVLRFFQISMAAFQLAGGFIFFVYALQMLRLLPSGIKTSSEEEEEGIVRENVAVVPLATPLMAGPGAITAVLVWRHRQDDLAGGMGVFVAAIVCACAVCYLSFRFSAAIRRAMGVSGIRVATRLMGLLLSVIAMEFMVNGLRQVLSGG